MTKKGITVLVVVSMLLAITSCGKKNQSNEKKDDDPNALTLSQVMKDVNQRNSDQLTKTQTVDKALYEADADNNAFTSEELEQLCTTHTAGIITQEEAIEDVNTMFKLLKNAYGGYTYFGGDQKIDEAKQQIINDIQSGNENLTPNDFVLLLVKDMSFLSDSHMMFNGIHVGQEAYCYYEDSNIKFYKDRNGYYTKINGSNWYAKPENEKYMKITITDNGELVYGMFSICMASESDSLPKSIVLSEKSSDQDSKKEDSKDREIEIDWEQSSIGKNSDKEYQYTEERNIPCQELSVMKFATSGANSFIDDAKKMAAADNSIVDIRVNSGGMPMNDYFWFYNYTGQMIDVNRSYMQRLNAINRRIVNQTTKNMWNVDLNPGSELEIIKNSYNIMKDNNELVELAKEIAKTSYTEDNNQNECIWSNGYYNINEQKMISNDKTLFVLQGKENYSAGETFVLLSQKVNNTLRVGTNTNGCIHTAPVATVNLPKSGVVMSYSCGILVGDDQDFDTYGIEPDIYIGGQDAKEAVQKCIEYYK